MGHVLFSEHSNNAVRLLELTKNLIVYEMALKMMKYFSGRIYVALLRNSYYVNWNKHHKMYVWKYLSQ